MAGPAGSRLHSLNVSAMDGPMEFQEGFLKIAEPPVQCEAEENPRESPEAILVICFAWWFFHIS